MSMPQSGTAIIAQRFIAGLTSAVEKNDGPGGMSEIDQSSLRDYEPSGRRHLVPAINRWAIITLSLRDVVVMTPRLLKIIHYPCR
jgi:hypothetical protein